MSDTMQLMRSYLEGTCKTVEEAAQYFDVDMDVEDIEEAMLDLNLERCPGCDWWMKSSELVDDDDEVVGCEQCRSESKAALDAAGES